MVQSTLQVPGHIAIIMDGNGRWAERRGASRSAGHLAGARALRTIVSHCATIGVPQLTLYAFSSDNWRRPADEVQALLTLFTSHFRSRAGALERHDIRLSVIGRRDRLPRTLVRVIANAEAATARGRRMHLRIAIDYSSRHAITRSRSDVDNAAATALLPAVDLMIRTGGERRLSDFLLWESAYAELAFLDVLWPDTTPDMIDAVCRDFAQRDRRFGGLTQRVSA